MAVLYTPTVCVFSRVSDSPPQTSFLVDVDVHSIGEVRQRPDHARCRCRQIGIIVHCICESSIFQSSFGASPCEPSILQSSFGASPICGPSFRRILVDLIYQVQQATRGGRGTDVGAFVVASCRGTHHHMCRVERYPCRMRLRPVSCARHDTLSCPETQYRHLVGYIDVMDQACTKIRKPDT